MTEFSLKPEGKVKEIEIGDLATAKA